MRANERYGTGQNRTRNEINWTRLLFKILLMIVREQQTKIGDTVPNGHE